MRCIYKYPLTTAYGPQTLNLPVNARVLHAGVQAGEIVIWCLVFHDDLEPRIFQVFGTGHRIPDTILVKEYIGTVTVHHRHAIDLVWHVLEVATPATPAI